MDGVSTPHNSMIAILSARMVLKRCVYGVDKNPMAVELAKVSLWLHTFTVGAPLSFLDHHLRCGNSLFGSWVQPAIKIARQQGEGMFLEPSVKQAIPSASSMQVIEGLTDAEIAEAHRSADVFAQISEMTAPLNAFLSLYHAFAWLNLSEPWRQDRVPLLPQRTLWRPHQDRPGRVAWFARDGPCSSILAGA